MEHHHNGMKIFTGNAHPALAGAIANALGLPLGKSSVSTFSDGEINVSIKESVRGSDVYVVQSLCQPVNDHLMELLIMIDAFKRASAGRITAVIPYLGYARQDRKVKARDPISARLVADLIYAAGANRVLTMDLHAPQIQGFYSIPLDHLQGVPILAPYFSRMFSGQLDQMVVVSPDLGSVGRARSFAEKVCCPLAIVDKRRMRANVCEVMNIIGDVKGKTAILVDDLIDTAGTLCNAAKALIETGGADKVLACATHGVLSGQAIERLNASVIEKLILLDTVPLVSGLAPEKLVSLSVAKVFADAIERIYSDKPVSSLFQ